MVFDIYELQWPKLHCSMHCEIGSKHFKNKIGAVGLTTVTSDMSTESVLEVKLAYGKREREVTRVMTEVETLQVENTA
jgi:hypothetical protein